MLKLRFDVSQYQPEEIVVKTVDNKLLVRIFKSYQLFFFLKDIVKNIVSRLLSRNSLNYVGRGKCE